MFTKHLNRMQQRADATFDPLIETPVDPVVDPVVDPLNGVPEDDKFAEQRDRRNREHGMSRQRQEAGDINGTPVDGADDNQTVGKTPSDLDVATGEFGEDATVKTTGDDVVVDADDVDVEFTNEMDDEDLELDKLEDGEDELDYLQSHMQQLAESMIAIESYGFNPTAAAILQTTGLLNGTALESLGLESIQFSSGKDAESLMALESMGEKIKEKSAEYSAKILHLVQSSGTKIMSVITPLYDKISKTIAALGNATWDKTKAAGAMVKAHPYKTAAAVVAAIGAVAAIVAICASGMPAPGGNETVMKSFLNKVREQISRIKFPGGSIMAKLSDNGTKIILEMKKVSMTAKAASLDALGWTASSVKAFSGQLNRATTVIKDAWGALGTRGAKIAHSAVEVVKGYGMTYSAVGGATLEAAGKGAAKAGMSKTAGVLGKVAGNTASSTAHKVGLGILGAGIAGGVGGAIGGAIGGFITGFISTIMALFKLTRDVVVGGLRLISATLNAIVPHTRTATA